MKELSFEKMEKVKGGCSWALAGGVLGLAIGLVSPAGPLVFIGLVSSGITILDSVNDCIYG